MPIDVPDMPPVPVPPSRIRFVYTLHLTDDQLGKLVHVLPVDLVDIRVKPTGHPDAPHRVTLSADADFGPAFSAFMNIHEIVQTNNLE